MPHVQRASNVWWRNYYAIRLAAATWREPVILFPAPVLALLYIFGVVGLIHEIIGGQASTG
jgi:hypothetical protein